MPRLFIDIALPETVQQALAGLHVGIPGARWTSPGQFHLTLRFLGDVMPAQLADLDLALAGVRAAPFDLELRGVGHFPPRGQPRVLWAGVAPSEALQHLQHRIERAVTRVGIEPEERKFHAHVTLARLEPASRSAAGLRARVAEFLAMHGLFRAGPFPVTAFQSMSSVLRPDGAVHACERGYDLAVPPASGS